MDTETSDDVVADEVAHVCEQLHAVECATRAEFLRQVARLQLTDDWKADGASSLSSWLSMRLGLSRSESAEIVKVADSVAFLPAILSAFALGKLSWKRLCLLVGLANPDSDQWWAENGPLMSLAQLQTLARKVSEDTEAAVSEAINDRSLTWRYRLHSLELRASLPLTDGEVVVAALERTSDSRSIDPETGLYPPLHQSAADALVELASLALAGDRDADRATIVIEAPIECFSGAGANGIVNGRAVAPSTVERLACDARLQVVTVDGATGRSLGIGRVSRVIPPWLHRLIKKRDQGCRFPGCGNTRWTHDHHIQFWSREGPTEEENLVTLCGTHHRFVHESSWKIEGTPSGPLTFVRPDGRRFDGSPPPLCQQAQLWVSRTHEELLRSG